MWCAILDFLENHDGAITAAATVVIAAFTVVLAWATNKLWRETRNSSDIALRAASAAEASAKTAQQSAEVLAKLERSDVFVFVNLIGEIVFAPSATKVQITFENHGRRAASIKRIRFNIFPSATVPARGENLTNAFTPSTGIVPVTTTPSKPEFRIETEYILPAHVFQQVLERKVNVLCVGIIEYEDVFGDWETGWCWALVPAKDQGFAVASDFSSLNYRT
jgi:hypothetical protein